MKENEGMLSIYKSLDYLVIMHKLYDQNDCDHRFSLLWGEGLDRNLVRMGVKRVDK